MKKIKLIQSNLMPLVTGLIFIWLFYLFYFKWWIKIKTPYDFFEKYSIFIPFIYWILTILILYILYLIKFIFRLNFFIVNLLLLLLVYGFNLFLWIQLVYFEPRFTEIAVFIIDAFWKSIMYSSIFTIIFVFISIFIYKKI